MPNPPARFSSRFPLNDINLIDGNDIDGLIEALRRGGTKTHFEKIGLAFKSSNLLLPILFPMGLVCFVQVQAANLKALNTSFYYKKILPEPVRRAISFDGATVRSEAPLTTILVVTSIGFSIISASYQGLKYWWHKNALRQTIDLLRWRQFDNAEKIRAYDLSTRQLEQINELLRQNNRIANDTIIQAYPSELERFATQAQAYIDQTNKFTSPLLALSLIPGFILIYRSAHELDGKVDCGMFPLFALFLDGCSVTEQYEVLSLLTYVWDCFSAAWFMGRFSTMTGRVLMQPFPQARHWFDQRINQPFSSWWDDEDKWLYHNLTGKILFYSLMPPVGGYAFYSAASFMNRYAVQSGCTSAAHIIDAFLFGNKDAPGQCSERALLLAISGFVGDFEIAKIYAAVIALVVLTFLTAYLLKRIPRLNQPATVQRAKDLLKRITELEKKILIACMVGVIVGGSIGFFPALGTADKILQEGNEVYFHMDQNALRYGANATLPEDLDLSQIPVFDLINQTQACTISSVVHIPDTILQENITLPGFDLTIPCVEFINNSTLGVQINPPCPNYRFLEIFGRNELRMPIDCDELTVTNSFGGFYGSFWFCVTMCSLVFGSALGGMMMSSYLIDLFRKTLRRSHSPRLFNPQPEGNNLELQPFLPRRPHLEPPANLRPPATRPNNHTVLNILGI